MGEEQGKTVLDLFMNYRSLFTYVNGIAYKAASGDSAQPELKSLSKNDVNCLYLNNVFSISDLHIAKIVAENIFSTVPIIGRSINYYHRTTPDNDKVALVQQMEHIKERLDKHLCRSQILYKTVYTVQSSRGSQDSKKKIYAYYTCTPHGYNFLKRIVGFSKTYDEYTGVLCIDQAFRYLSVVTVCQHFYKVPGFENYQVQNQEYTVNVKTGRKWYSPYGIVKINNGNNPVKVVVEPFHLSFNRNRVSETDYVNDLKNRFTDLNDYMQKVTAEGKVYIIFSCEDIQSVKAAVELTKQYLPLFTDNVYFTIDRLGEEIGIERCCLQWNGTKTVPVTIEFL